MTPEHPSKHAGWFTGRTRLITVVSIIAVGLAGATAVSANIGILDSASESPVGNASVTGAIATPSTQVGDVSPPEATATTAATIAATLPGGDPTVQQFAVDVAGTVAVAATGTGLRLDHVTPSAGWTWSLAQSDPNTLTLTLRNGSRTVEFTATASADGNIAARVTAPVATSASADNRGGHQDDEHDDDEEYEEYEGGEDDD